MPDQIALDALRQEIFATLEETFENVRGIYLDKNTSLLETLETISAEEASRPVSATCASIAAQVEHTRFYLDVIDRSLQGEELGKIDWDATWRLVLVTVEEWEALKERLRTTYRGVLVTLQRSETWDGADAIGDALAILAHTAYHLGEIRQALCTVKRSAPGPVVSTVAASTHCWLSSLARRLTLSLGGRMLWSIGQPVDDFDFQACVANHDAAEREDAQWRRSPSPVSITSPSSCAISTPPCPGSSISLASP